jgi:hypothetical protein
MGGCGCKKKNTQATTQTTTQQTQDQVVNVAVQLREMIEKKEL